MIALLCLFLALSVSQFKSKSRLERGAPTSTDCAAADGARSRPLHEQRSPVLCAAVSLVSVSPQGRDDHPARDPCALASCRLSPLLALEISPSGRPAANRCGPAGADPADERGKSA